MLFVPEINGVTKLFIDAGSTDTTIYLKLVYRQKRQAKKHSNKPETQSKLIVPSEIMAIIHLHTKNFQIDEEVDVTICKNVYKAYRFHFQPQDLNLLFAYQLKNNLLFIEANVIFKPPQVLVNKEVAADFMEFCDTELGITIYDAKQVEMLVKHNQQEAKS